MRKKIDKLLGYFLIFLMVIMTLDVLWGVGTRYILGNQASWSEELARFLLIWIGVLGAAYTSGQNLHLSIDLISSRLNTSNKRIRTVILNGCIILFAFFVLIIGGMRLLYITNVLGQTSPALQVPMSVVYAVIPISGLLIVYYKIYDLMMPPLKETTPTI